MIPVRFFQMPLSLDVLAAQKSFASFAMSKTQQAPHTQSNGRAGIQEERQRVVNRDLTERMCGGRDDVDSRLH